MILVFDSTPLIYFAKLRILDKLAKLKAELVIPKSVYEEVVAGGKRKAEEDALFIEKLVSQSVFKINEALNKTLARKIASIRSVGYADAETLALAKDLNCIAIVDESAARTIAEAEGIKYRGSVFILFLLSKENLIHKKDIKFYVDKMISLGWRCSTEFYSAILDAIAKL
ncbi:DUF3368 domain-containing protein [Candidatus Woesearchaeota archaeon]|nr:DUF3368 domain-containing protein [Candidatus Woesearchaeota archaeon]